MAAEPECRGDVLGTNVISAGLSTAMTEPLDCDIHPGQVVRVTATGQSFVVSEVAAVIQDGSRAEWSVSDPAGRWFGVAEIETPSAAGPTCETLGGLIA